MPGCQLFMLYSMEHWQQAGLHGWKPKSGQRAGQGLRRAGKGRFEGNTLWNEGAGRALGGSVSEGRHYPRRLGRLSGQAKPVAVALLCSRKEGMEGCSTAAGGWLKPAAATAAKGNLFRQAELMEGLRAGRRAPPVPGSPGRATQLQLCPTELTACVTLKLLH